MLINASESYYRKLSNYIHYNIVLKSRWPKNVLIRDYIRNICEFAYYKKWCEKEELEKFRPPYQSDINVLTNRDLEKNKQRYSQLYWRCTESDFARYTIPNEVLDYGLTKKQVGEWIFEKIIDLGYDEIIECDQNVNYLYGASRSRDESVERVGKKYQKICLYNLYGIIQDNFEFKPRFSDYGYYVKPEQGTLFRLIDLTNLQKISLTHCGQEECYPFYKYNDLTDEEWFEYEDIEHICFTSLKIKYELDEYLIMQGYFTSDEENKEEYRSIWYQIRMYLYDKKDEQKVIEWAEKRHYSGRWMPEGVGSMYENQIGEYPWSPTCRNDSYERMLNKENLVEQCILPTDLIVTVHGYINEHDSSFCDGYSKQYMYPSTELIEFGCLEWNGFDGYKSKGDDVVLNLKPDKLYINKRYLEQLLLEHSLGVLWTVTGEKQKFVNNFHMNRPDRTEYSYSYILANGSLKKIGGFFEVQQAIKKLY